MKKMLLVLLVMVLALLVVFVTRKPVTPPSDSQNITSFEECQKAGNPIMESYPEQCRTPDGKTFTRNIGNELEKADLIQLDFPRPNEIVSSPLTITGQARGTWFFEASFPARLVDANGKELGKVVVQATSDWMTEDFVPFAAELKFSDPTTDTGELILEKDNPSGLAENADELRVPVRFR